MWIFRRSSSSKVNDVSSKLLIVSSGFMAYTHGKNDGQMPMGIIALTLMGYCGWNEFHIPMWVVIISAASISLGTAIGGKRVIGTVGLKITKLRPVHGFAADISAAMVIEGASHVGIPVSTTHCISAALMGVGSTKRLSAVRWGVARSIVIAWLVTFPVCAGLGWAFAKLLEGLVI
ncbi:MAG: inorganic phosphate transporter, partial [Dehalococcoidia bacterium]|nr:inorganic phosphate transporter [Dehalococcoidia bacterium]